MTNNFNTNTKNDQTWLTPPDLLMALGEFDLDPCAAVNQPWRTAQKQYTKLDDGLSQKWFGRVWLNPPYGRETFKWLARLAEHKRGLALIFARTETKGFHSEIWEKAHSVFFFKGRLRFYHVSGEQGGTANAPSCIVSYSKEETYLLLKLVANKQIKGRLVELERNKND